MTNARFRLYCLNWHPTLNTPPIKVALVEDDDVIRESLSVLINGAAGFVCVCASASAELALQAVPQAQPNVALIDVNLPGMSGIECVARLKQACPQMQIVMLTMFEDDDAIFNSLAAGATGYLLKRTPHVQILDAIEDVHAGGSPMTGSIARRLVRSFQQTRPSPRDEFAPQPLNLSPREQEVLTCLAQGYRYKEIADRLAINVETVRTHLRRIYEKLHVSSRTEAVVKFLGK